MIVGAKMKWHACRYLAGAESAQLGGHGLVETSAAPGDEIEEDGHLCR